MHEVSWKANEPWWSLRYTSQRSPVMARNVVAAAHPLAAQAGLTMLTRGGSAADAAVAAAIVLTVVEPTCSSVGSDLLAQVFDQGAVTGLNASGRSPAQRIAGVDSAIPDFGWPAVTVPGAVSGWVALSQRFGRLPFALLFEPAIGYARAGFHLTPVVARVWRGLQPFYTGFAELLAEYYPHGQAPKIGSLVKFPALAATLEAIAESGGRAFYTGHLAEAMAAHARNSGGHLSQEDLAAHDANWVTPLSAGYRGVTLHELPPNSQGLAALIALGILQRLEVRNGDADEASSVHSQIEATKLALLDSHAHVCDPDTMQIRCDELLDPDRLAALAASVSASATLSCDGFGGVSGGTSYVAAADANGMMVSLIQSNGQGFGSGIVVPGTGIALHSRANAFSTTAGHPNAYAPRKLPFHTNCPAIVTRGDEALACFGLMGGTMQPQAHVQFMTRLFDLREQPQAVLDAPRWRVAAREPGVLLEPPLDALLAEPLRQRGHTILRVERRLPGASTPFGSHLMFGGAQMITRVDGGYMAATDPRRDGQAVGY